MTTRCGTVALVGRPNVGKSTLLNAMLGTPLSMVSDKPQATRQPVIGVHTTSSAQLILRDLPGLLEPKYLLQQSLRTLALEGLADADLLLYLHPAPEAPAPPIRGLLPDCTLPDSKQVLTAYTKADLAIPEVLHRHLGDRAVAVSQDDPDSIARLVELLASLLPVGPFRHDPEALGTQPVRFFVGEYLREAAFLHLHSELPYAVAVAVEEFREERSPIYIRAILYVERDSQKGIVIGQGGAMLKILGSHARARLEELIGAPVYLDTRVKVLPNWRRRRGLLTRFGLTLPDQR